jgi:uncharacterized cupredoxin-like copper-binding protein
MTIRRHLALAATLVALTAAACGDDDDDESTTGDAPARTIEVDMVDIAFEPDTIEVNAGETVRFVFTNTGDVAHDAFIGDADAQADHEAQMSEAEDEGHGGGHGEDDSDAITVEPGGTGELTHTFDESTSLEIGCHQPGHYDAGMKIDVTVS